MLALVFDGQTLRLDAHHAAPPLMRGEALISPTRMGISAADLDICRGKRPFVGILGHEFVGTVEAVGDKAHKDWLGKRVAGSIDCVRSVCDLCRSGLREHARDRSVLGLVERDGCFAEQFTLPIENLFAVPDHVDDDHAVFVEPLAAAYQVLRQLTVAGRPFITVLGDGTLGLLVGQVVNQLNATVRVVGKHESKLQLCEKWGIRHRLLHEIGLHQDQDIVIDCSGSPAGLSTALKMVRPRGTVVMKTLTASASLPLDLSPLVTNEITLIGSRGGPFPEALDALSAQKVDVVSLISRRARLVDVVDALKAASQPGTLKVLLEP